MRCQQTVLHIKGGQDMQFMANYSEVDVEQLRLMTNSTRAQKFYIARVAWVEEKQMEYKENLISGISYQELKGNPIETKLYICSRYHASLLHIYKLLFLKLSSFNLININFNWKCVLASNIILYILYAKQTRHT